MTKECSSNPIAKVVSDLNNKDGIIPFNDNRELQYESRKEKAELERYESDTLLKTILVYFVAIFTAGWSIAILVFLYLYGFNKVYASDALMIALFTQTLFIVLGLPLVVTHHFFPKQ